jgi:simple sugar transport system permease protein
VLYRFREFIQKFGLPRLIIISFLLFLYVLAFALKIPLSGLFSDSLVRLGMHSLLVLAMLPAIQSGIGPNFGLPLGIICGLIGALMAIELDLYEMQAVFTAIIIAIPLAIIVGWGYGWLLNKVKGSEMMVATYVGFSSVSLMNIGWVMLPFTSNEMKWPIGRGLRVTITIATRYEKVLNNLWKFSIGDIMIPTGLLLFCGILCLAVWLFARSKAGVAMRAVGDSRRFAEASGINTDRYRIIGAILSTVLGAIGIVAFAQSFGFIQLYEAPMFMGFGAVAAILIGGATVKKASISNVIIGTFLFQSLLVVALPVANKLVTTGSLAEITRIIVQNGVILYALTQIGGGE